MPPRIRPTPEQLDRLARSDPLLGAAMSRLTAYPGFPHGVLARGSHFQAIARSVTFQQLAGAAARTIYGRVCELTPGERFPTASECLALPDEAFRGAGLSSAKTRAIKDLAGKCADGSVRLRAVGRMSDAEIIEMLTAVWGIGEWTAQMFLIFRLGRLDVMPAGDLGVRAGVRILDGLDERPTQKAVLERAEVWRPLRSVATWLMYRLCDES
ncbi:MAG: DNA-3-methyladenine glycosylase 2 family protein [Gemmatimonadetes bacterium]|nr:DNA-3-methyladenine glycosylase 2 family protein [Gemmatimonadota bacterium]MYG23836.1 DNA-3-methyladenine glycosylase 2 family protein [Gemmatimonadota bacterium]MYJ40429.1 DNA-3-methyladenine glycosylase 2 family protein [Gemmatimonadota bacterium]